MNGPILRMQLHIAILEHLSIECTPIIRRSSYQRMFLYQLNIGESLRMHRFSETDELKAEIENLKRQNNEMRVVIDNLNAQSKLVRLDETTESF